MTITPGPADLARWLLQAMKDLGYWKFADPQRPPPPALPSDGDLASTQQVYNAALLFEPTYEQQNEILRLKQWADGCPRFTRM